MFGHVFLVLPLFKLHTEGNTCRQAPLCRVRSEYKCECKAVLLTQKFCFLFSKSYWYPAVVCNNCYQSNLESRPRYRHHVYWIFRVYVHLLHKRDIISLKSKNAELSIVTVTFRNPVVANLGKSKVISIHIYVCEQGVMWGKAVILNIIRSKTVEPTHCIITATPGLNWHKKSKLSHGYCRSIKLSYIHSSSLPSSLCL